MNKKLGSNPLDSLEIENKGDLNYLTSIKGLQNSPKQIFSNPPIKIIEGVEDSKYLNKKLSSEPKLNVLNEETAWNDCIHLRCNGDRYFCYSTKSRSHGFMGNKEKAKEKCNKCHVNVLK